MRTLICCNVFGNYNEVNQLTQPINQNYADNHNCDFLVDTHKRCDKTVKSFWWEKIAFLQAILQTRNENDLIVWIDADSLIQSDTDINHILEDDKELGMVPIYAGKNNAQIQNWYNAGVIAMKNTEEVRKLMDSVWERRTIDQDDETAIIHELDKTKIKFQDLKPEWNCWKNNEHLVEKPKIKTFHGVYPFEAKVSQIKDFLKHK